MRNLFQAKGRLAHFADALAQRGGVFGTKVRVEAEGVLQFEDRLSRNARGENLVQALEGVVIALEARDALLDGKPRFHGFFHRAQAAQRRQTSIWLIRFHDTEQLNWLNELKKLNKS